MLETEKCIYNIHAIYTLYVLHRSSMMKLFLLRFYTQKNVDKRAQITDVIKQSETKYKNWKFQIFIIIKRGNEWKAGGWQTNDLISYAQKVNHQRVFFSIYLSFSSGLFADTL